MSKQAAIVAILIAGAAAYLLATTRSRPASIEAAFWFDDVAFDSSRLGSPLTAGEIATIESVAREELRHAFRGLPISISARRDARYTLRVVQEVLDLRFKRPVGVAGQSRGIAGFGGSGSVSFDFLANGAMAWAPGDADRAELVAAIGRGIGRTAVHEFTHQLLPTAPIHASRDDQSYEYQSAARRAQYYGPMRWDLAWPLLQQKIGG
ncbi:MAG TPA: hypothetical protein VFD69_18745 [Vicinamibacterales bacterium]|jgi:hypothetical protein|nr:hypothetical protein [Vicinamibacterales bacterium]